MNRMVSQGRNERERNARKFGIIISLVYSNYDVDIRSLFIIITCILSAQASSMSGKRDYGDIIFYFFLDFVWHHKTVDHRIPVMI